jgi:hypothetical protein
MDASKEVDLEINAEKTRLCCFLITRKQVKIKTTKRSFENLTIQIFGNGSNKSKFDSGENN